MSAFDKLVDDYVARRVVPGVVGLAKDKTGKLIYSKAAGVRSLRPGHEEPLGLDSVFTFKSATKLCTVVAVLQLLERGLVALDEDVGPRLPELAAQPILRGFASEADDAPAVLEPRRNPITLRHLLTHTSGLAYPPIHPLLDRHSTTAWLAADDATVESKWAYPLVFEPGEGFLYGAGMDWAGRLVEKATGQDLEAYFAEHIFAPVGARGLTFFPERRPDLVARLVELPVRDPATRRLAPGPGPFTDPPAKTGFGGTGLYGELPEYLKVPESLLLDDERLLGKATRALLFEPQLGPRIGPKAKEACLALFKDGLWSACNVPDTGEYEWALGGLLVDGDSHEYRKKGCLLWGGMYHSAWFIDRGAGLTGVFASQLLPNADKETETVLRAFEAEVYSKVN